MFKLVWPPVFNIPGKIKISYADYVVTDSPNSEILVEKILIACNFKGVLYIKFTDGKTRGYIIEDGRLAQVS